ncbi:MAG: DUF1616 domain-containing protein [Candidatus Thermoplasmatota archaeon]
MFYMRAGVGRVSSRMTTNPSPVRVPRWDLVGSLAVVAVGVVGVVLGPLAPPLAWLILPALLASGYVLTLALFPLAARSRDERGALYPVERAGAAFLLAFALIPLVALVIQGTPFRFRLLPFSVSIAVLTLVAALVALARRIRAEGTLPVPARPPRPHVPREQRAALAAFAVGSLVLVGTGAWVLPAIMEPRPFTEALLLPQSGVLSDVAKPVPNRSIVSFTLVVTSHERGASSVNVSWALERAANASAGRDGFVATPTDARDAFPLSLMPGSAERRQIDLGTLAPGLYRLVVSVDERPLRTMTLDLHAWIEVTE